MQGVSVVIPVGPNESHRRYLPEAISSVVDQKPNEILIIDDMNGLAAGLQRGIDRIPVRTWKSPWRLGVAHAFNFGVALAQYDCCILLGSDDMLLPGCIESSMKAYYRNKQEDAYYGFGVKYSDGREDQFIPCGAAMVTKGLWRKTGGFPVESSSGASDCALLSINMVHHIFNVYLVSDKKPLYWYRVHEESDTAGLGSWQGVILETRDRLTSQWKAPAWGRF